MQGVKGNTTQGSRENSLYVFLKENDFHVDRSIAVSLEKIIISSRKAILLRGPAGVGKTQLTWLIAQWLNAEYVFFQCTYGTDEDTLLYKYVPSESTRSGIKITLGPIPRALKISQRKKVVLVLDEFDKTRPSADALLLDVLQNTRVSLYLDDETIITGNPDNLIIILTSNDMREFSEPLLRRLIVITLNPLPTATVYEMLKKQFKENIALLLTQIYDDTIKAGLRKPATIQELQQLGQILENGTDVPLQELLRMFIIKYDDDWVKFMQYVSSREPYKFVNDNANSDDVTQYYEPPKAEVQIQQSTQEQTQSSTAQLLEKISKIVIKQPNDSVVKAVKEEVSGTVEVAFKAPISENDFTMYTNIIREFWPEPSSTPEIFGKFRVVKDANEYKIVSEKPLTLLEYFQLLNNNDVDFEGYIEDKLVLVNPATINKILNEAHRIKYYSNKKLQVTFNYSNSGYGSSCSVTELIEIELEDTYSPNKKNTLVNATIRAYVKVWRKGYISYESLLRRMIKNLYNADISVDGNLGTLVEFIKQEIRFRKHNLSPSIEVTLRSGDFEKIMDVLSKEFKLDVKDIDAIKSKGIAKIYYNEYYGTIEVRPP